MDSPQQHTAEDNEQAPGQTAPPALPQVPWENRKEIGLIRAYLQTAWIAMFRPEALAILQETPVCRKHARSFRRVTVQLTAIITLGVLIAWPFIIFPAGPSLEDSQSRYEPVVQIVFLRFLLAVGSLIGLFLATRSLEWFCSPEDAGEDRRDSAISLSCYACSPVLVVTVIGAIVFIVAINTWTTYDIWMTMRILNYAWWAVFLIWWPAAARAIYFISGRSPRRTALAALLLPLIWMGQQLLVAFIPISIAHWFLMISSTI
jgi:hypothetical protein